MYGLEASEVDLILRRLHQEIEHGPMEGHSGLQVVLAVSYRTLRLASLTGLELVACYHLLRCARATASFAPAYVAGIALAHLHSCESRRSKILPRLCTA